MLLWQMPITIRNKALEERIRVVAKRTGETPSDLIDRLSREDLERLEAEDLKAKRIAAMNRSGAMLPKLADEDRRDKPSCG
ncbi:MAG: hypothetical protein QOH65_2622 [Methylobacteriaceae bacterium]|jgi:hypothetical protein|nr:hypothetical protein [Methylobacteriaceae bacterium]